MAKKSRRSTRRINTRRKNTMKRKSMRRTNRKRTNKKRKNRKRRSRKVKNNYLMRGGGDDMVFYANQPERNPTALYNGRDDGTDLAWPPTGNPTDDIPRGSKLELLAQADSVRSPGSPPGTAVSWSKILYEVPGGGTLVGWAKSKNISTEPPVVYANQPQGHATTVYNEQWPPVDEFFDAPPGTEMVKLEENKHGKIPWTKVSFPNLGNTKGWVKSKNITETPPGEPEPEPEPAAAGGFLGWMPNPYDLFWSQQASVAQVAVAPPGGGSQSRIYGTVEASTGDNVELVFYNADTTGLDPNPNPTLRVYGGNLMFDMREPSTQIQMFVLPSQLNAAEYMSKDSIPGSLGKANTIYWLDMYKMDRTGGPRGQLAGDHKIAEYIVEHAFNELNKEDLNTIHYVREICESIPGIDLVNGYLGVDSSQINDENLGLLRSMMGTVKLLVSKDLPVSGYIPGDKWVDEPDDIERKLDTNAYGGVYPERFKHPEYEDKKVHLAYASAVPVNCYGNDGSAKTVAVADIIMEAQYTAALKAAKDLGVQELYLMPLGGKSFGNSGTNIIKNLMNSLRKVNMSGCDVILLTYGPDEADVYQGYLNAAQ